MPTVAPKTIIITGCGHGIGKDTAFALSARGHTVIATTETEHDAETLRTDAKKKNLQMEIYKLDITNPVDREKILQHSNIDVLINNAAIGQSGSLAETPLELIRQVFEVNVFAPIALTQIALRQMIQKNQGKVIFVSSTAGRISMPFLGPYCMTKFSLSSGAEALRKEIRLVAPRVYISLIEPGAYSTGFNQRMIATNMAWSNPKSYFYGIKDTLRAKQERLFSLIEHSSTKSIVAKIITAVETPQSKLRYSAPWSQALGVRIVRIFGK